MDELLRDTSGKDHSGTIMSCLEFSIYGKLLHWDFLSDNQPKLIIPGLGNSTYLRGFFIWSFPVTA